MDESLNVTKDADAPSGLNDELGKSMTDENAEAWANMGIKKDWQIKRLTEWANMLERRVAEFDPRYRGYPFGRMPNAKLNAGQRREEE